MFTRSMARAAALAVTATVAIGCSNNSSGPDNSSGPEYNPQIPTAWASAVTNTFFPLVPGTSFEFEGETEDGLETVVVEVLSDTRIVNGVTATVVRDRVYLDGELIEDTYDWYAQDAAGNVWYVGEDSKEIEGGVVVNTEGSWEWGVDDALPGIIMWADPAAHIGEEYRQEFYEEEAEDWGKVLAVNETVVVPYGTFTGCVKTEDWNALENGGREAKYYAPQVGFVYEIHLDGESEPVELVEITEPK